MDRVVVKKKKNTHFIHIHIFRKKKIFSGYLQYTCQLIYFLLSVFSNFMIFFIDPNINEDRSLRKVINEKLGLDLTILVFTSKIELLKSTLKKKKTKK